MIRRQIRFTKQINIHKIQSSQNVRSWRNALSGVPAFLIGNSPSLDDIDIGLLNDYFTIGINRVYLRIDPTILIWQDKEIFNENKEAIKSLQAIKFCPSNLDKKGEFHNFRLMQNFYRLPHSPFVLFGKNGSTGVLAFELAFVLGCNPIILLGMDCKYRNGKTDFYGVNKFHNSSSLNNCSRGLSWIASCQEITTIITCNPIKRITNCQSLESVFSSIESGSSKGRVFFQKKLLQNNYCVSG